MAHVVDHLRGIILAPPDQPVVVSTCTVYTLMKAREDARVDAALRRADLLVADGMPLVWLQRRRGYPAAERIYGPDLMIRLCAPGDHAPPLRHFLYGGQPGVAERLTERLRQSNPKIEICGSLSPPYRPDIATTVDPAAVEQINASGANVVWVGLGSPKQDVWMHTYRQHLDAHLLIGVGAAFDFLSGSKPQAPRWMRRSGLEWLFRLVTEPRRLWRRYLIYNARFLYALARKSLTGA